MMNLLRRLSNYLARILFVGVLISGVVAAGVFALQPAAPVYAATTTLYPASNGYYQQLACSTPNPCTHYSVVSDGNYATRLKAPAYRAYYYDTYGLTSAGADPGASNITVTVWWVQTNSDQQMQQPLLRLNGSNTFGTYHIPTTYGTWIWSETLARPGGGTWTWSDLASLEAGVGIYLASAQTNYLDEVWVVVSYTTGINIATLDGAAKASLVTVDGVTFSNIKSLDGIQ